MPEAHKAQLLLCHQSIAVQVEVADGLRLARHWCDLRAYAWCYTCDYYVCDVHLNSRHYVHETVVEFPHPEPTAASRRMRRSGR